MITIILNIKPDVAISLTNSFHSLSRTTEYRSSCTKFIEVTNKKKKEKRKETKTTGIIH